MSLLSERPQFTTSAAPRLVRSDGAARSRARVAAQCRLLVEDPDLGAVLPERVREQATVECVAPMIRLPRGRLDEVSRLCTGGIGLLVIEGLLFRRVGIGGRYGGELLGEGDLLRPWQASELEPGLTHTTGWRVLEAARLVVLDVRAAYRLARYPELTGALVGRALERARSFAVNMAIVHQPKVELRLHMLFWHLAGRWGRVSLDGVRLPLRLTHTVLADLVAARRPTVTGALAKLAAQGLLEHDQASASWLLRGEPPGELLEVRPGLGSGQPALGRGASGGRDGLAAAG
jgi:CRP/FNR family cyclic AMP-dependent transcriptional regulator